MKPSCNSGCFTECLLFCLAEVLKSQKSESDLSLSWFLFFVPYLLTHRLLIIASACLINSFI